MAILAPFIADGASAYRISAGARSMSLGDSVVADAADPLAAMSANPSGMTSIRRRTIQIGATGVLASGRFSNGANPEARIRNRFGALPELGAVFPIPAWRSTVGFSVIPEAALEGAWRFNDTAGGLGGSANYGLSEYRSRFLALRSALGAATRINDRLAIGFSVGAVYNENTLIMPYVFQSHPALTGFKTQLHTESDGMGWNGQIGLTWKVDETLQFGLSYRTETAMKANGFARGNAGAQFAALGGAFAGLRPDFNYAAEVENVLPRTVSAGAAWIFAPDWRLTTQFDWLNWGNAFQVLPITLTQGDNADINAFVGSTQLYDEVPLNWRDQFFFRIGVEHSFHPNWRLRCGYSYARSPVPDTTLTPLTAVIFEHGLAAGIGYDDGVYGFDLGYRVDLPRKRSVGATTLAAGEFANSSTKVGLHSLGISLRRSF